MGKEGKPRGRMSAYAYFVQTCSQEHKKNHPNENMVFIEFSKKCAEGWKTMNDTEKGRFHVLAENDKKRYDGEMANYQPPKGEKGGKKRKRTKDPNAPKRALTAFFWFCNEERSGVKQGMADATVGEVAKVLGRRWHDCTEHQKSKYGALAAKDKARYEKEVNAYKAKKGKPAPAIPIPKIESEDEDDDDEDDEDDTD